MLVLVLASEARAIGTSTIIFDYPTEVSAEATAIHAAVVVADGQIWWAVEWAEDNDVLTDTNLDLFHWDGSDLDRKTLSDGRLNNGTALMYPSIETWPDAVKVKVVGKEDVGAGQEAHLEFFSLDRDTIETATVQTSGVASTGNDIEHGRMHLAFDHNNGIGTPSEALYVCYTRHDTNPAEADNVWSKGKPHDETWGSHTVQTIANNSTAEDDHCQMAFTHAGERFTVYHSDVNSQDDAFLQLDELTDPANDTWDDIAEFALTTDPHIDVDFPSLSISVPSSSVSNMSVVAQRPLNDDYIVWWACGTSLSLCDSAAEWDDGVATDLDGDDHYQPEVRVVAYNQYVVWANDAAGVFSVGLASMCSGQTDWTFEGELAKAGFDDCTWKGEFAGTPIPGSSVPQIDYDPDTGVLSVVMLCADNGTETWVPVRWYDDETDYCP